MENFSSSKDNSENTKARHTGLQYIVVKYVSDKDLGSAHINNTKNSIMGHA